MTRKEALSKLSSEDYTERLAAANALSIFAKPADLAAILAARDREGSPWVQHTLDRIVASLGGEPSLVAGNGGSSGAIIASADSRDLESRVVYDVTRMVLHELSPIVGRLEVRATEELRALETSRTGEEIRRLQTLTMGLQHLAHAAERPRPIEVDLGALVREIAKRALSPFGAEVERVASFAGLEPLFADTDPSLLELVLSNAVRNAYEAVVESGGDSFGALVITWAATRSAYWIAIRDNGPGLSESPEKLFSTDFSTKGHSGFGLYTAKLAARSLGGTVDLKNASGGGAIFRIEWKR
jgi:signal transduction histidine kinase